MKKTLQTIGFLALLITATQGYTATEEVVTDPQTAARSVITSSFDDSTGLLRGKGLVIINDLWDRFQVTFHGDAYALVSVLKTLSTLSPGKIVEAAFSAQDARNAEAAAKTAAAMAAADDRTLLGRSFRGLGLEDVTAHAGALDDSREKQIVKVGRIEGELTAATEALAALKGEKNTYAQANDLVSDVSRWGKKHQIDPTITDAVAAAEAWVARRKGKFDIDQRNAKKREKLVLAQSVLALVQKAPTVETMTTLTETYKKTMSETKGTIEQKKEELKTEKRELKKLKNSTASAASRVKALTPKGTPTSGGGEGFATPTGRK